MERGIRRLSHYVASQFCNSCNAGTDGTPNESMQDVLVRVRQLLSITETQYTGQDVLIVAPDSFTLSALQAAALGVDLTEHGGYFMAPGEVCCTVVHRSRHSEHRTLHLLINFTAMCVRTTLWSALILVHAIILIPHDTLFLMHAV